MSRAPPKFQESYTSLWACPCKPNLLPAQACQRARTLAPTEMVAVARLDSGTRCLDKEETAVPASGLRPVRGRFFAFYRPVRVRPASAAVSPGGGGSARWK
eukprot:gene8248-biopygen19622